MTPPTKTTWTAANLAYPMHVSAVSADKNLKTYALVAAKISTFRALATTARTKAHRTLKTVKHMRRAPGLFRWYKTNVAATSRKDERIVHMMLLMTSMSSSG